MIDFATVIFNKELEFLKTQAKSISLYCTHDLVDNIFVVVNDKKEVCNLINLDWYRDFSYKVSIIHVDELTSVADDMQGWDSQQLLKLLIAARSNNVYCHVLDAKTWFVNSAISLMSDMGLPNCVLMKMFENFTQSAIFLSKYFNQDINQIIGPGGVPFAFHTHTVRCLIDHIETNEKQSFDLWFKNKVQYPINVTEFTLYSAFVITNKLFSKLYSEKQKHNVVNIADFQIAEFDSLLKQMHTAQTLTASIHRNVYQLLTHQQYDKWCQFLSYKKLYVSPEIAKMQLNTFRPGVYNDTGIRL